MSSDDHQQTAIRYDASLAADIETRWQLYWDEHQTNKAPNPGEAGFDASKPKYYCLDMFPYPSGAGLHVGHPEGYTATDIICRYKRMTGHNVLHPMGWDAFGLPAEQYAIQTGVHPEVTTKTAIDNFRRQLKRFGFCYDWSREFGTIDPDYYKWTQWIFLQIYNSWFDVQADNGKGKARPIAELIEELESGARTVKLNPSAAEYTGAGDLPDGTDAGDWSTLDRETKKAIIDSYRLAYLSEQTVNWCPKLGTALANEEVINGLSERGSYPVHRKPLRQWMFRITSYADRLLDGLADLDWPSSTKTQQAEWIGRSVGAEIDFPIIGFDGDETGEALRVFTTRPDTIFGATYMVVAPEHPLVELAMDFSPPDLDTKALTEYVSAARDRTDIERQENKEKTGVNLGMKVRNPVTKQLVSVWTSDYVLMGYGTGAIMAVPGQDQRDWDFAKAFDLPIVRTVEPTPDFDGEAYTGTGKAINSDFLDGMDIAEAKTTIIDWLTKHKAGAPKVNYKLRDWLFSRQRYWGEPFPIVFDEWANHYPVSEDQLPVMLPPLTDYAPVESSDPQPLLAKAEDWVKVTAGEVGVSEFESDKPMKRETNTMPGWAGSCWYYLRYCDSLNSEKIISDDAQDYWLGDSGVDLYIGGNEHAVLHLLYARFWHMCLHDLGHVQSDEPFRKLFHQGMITSMAYQRADKSLVAIDEVENKGTEDAPSYIETATGKTVDRIVAKMSKSLKNVINPDDVIADYGADTFRLYEMYMGPLEASKPWSTRDIVGLQRLLQKIWRLVTNEDATLALGDDNAADQTTEKQLHRLIAKAGADIEKLSFNTAIAAIFEFVNSAQSTNKPLTRDQLDCFVRVLSPFVPHLAEELWDKLGNPPCVAHADWPSFDEAMLVDDEIEIPVQVMGKLRSKIIMPKDADNKAMEAAALADERIIEFLGDKQVRKVIVVPGRLVNIVAN
ncbi:MAG: leucine--tRNA ligase [Phycisphaerales bacterium]